MPPDSASDTGSSRSTVTMTMATPKPSGTSRTGWRVNQSENLLISGGGGERLYLLVLPETMSVSPAAMTVSGWHR
ncbi:hypothetical protein GCM10029992_23720 [Glycomyces albus]